MTEKTRLRDSERRKMLVDYLKDGSVPEGFYVKVMKNDNISFRRFRPVLNKEEKIMRLERQIEKLKQTDAEQTTSDSSSESKQENETPLNPTPPTPHGQTGEALEALKSRSPRVSEEAKPDDDSDW